jgi:hypothetical protein
MPWAEQKWLLETVDMYLQKRLAAKRWSGDRVLQRDNITRSKHMDLAMAPEGERGDLEFSRWLSNDATNDLPAISISFKDGNPPVGIRR